MSRDSAVSQIPEGEIILKRREEDGSTLVILPTLAADRIRPDSILETRTINSIEEIFLSQEANSDSAA